MGNSKRGSVSLSTRPLRQHDLRSDAERLIARATRLYVKRVDGMDYPGFRGSDVERFGGRDYVVLRSVEGVLAVYRIGAFDSLNWVEKDDYPEELRHAER